MKKNSNLILYYSKRIENGDEYPIIVSNVFGDHFAAFFLKDDTEYFYKTKWKTALAEDVVLIRDIDTFVVISPEEYVEKFKNLNLPDLLIAKEIVKIFRLKCSADEIYAKSPKDTYRKKREVETINKMKQYLSSNKLSQQELLNYNAILLARDKGMPLDFVAISDDCARKLPSMLYAEGIRFAIMSSFVEENFDEEKELNVDDIIKNDMDNLLIFLNADRDFVMDMACGLQYKELIELSASVDTMSLEELMSFKSRVQGLSVSGHISASQISKFSTTISNVEKITEQIKQEAYERKDVYGLEDREDIYSDLVL